MEILLRQKIKELEDGKWKLKFKGHELEIKDLAEPVVGVVECRESFGTVTLWIASLGRCVLVTSGTFVV